MHLKIISSRRNNKEFTWDFFDGVFQGPLSKGRDGVILHLSPNHNTITFVK